MFANYFKIGFRNLLRNKWFSFINLLGLVIGMTVSGLIFLWVNDELTFNKFQKGYEQIYQVIANRDFKNRVFTDRNMVLPLASVLENSNPQIKHAVVTTYRQDYVFANGQDKIKKQGFTVSEHYFKIFSWKFIKGDPSSALSNPGSIVLTESAAHAFFGNDDPINKSLKSVDNQLWKVTGIIADPPGNSTFQFDFIKPFNFLDSGTAQSMRQWYNSSWNVFIETTNNANMALVDKHINEIKKAHSPNDQVSTYFSFPMRKWELFSDFKDGKNIGGRIEYVRLFTIIAIIILMIACVNFMNLSTARSEKRAKEVGIRKTLGSHRIQLVLQFFAESLILACIAFLLSLAAVYLLVPAFNLLVGKQLILDLNDPAIWLGSLAIILFTGIIAGSYPALYLSSFNPVRVLKGSFLPGRKAAMPRHILVVAQFVISVLLISATIIVYEQIHYIRDRSIGYNSNQLIIIPASEATRTNFSAIKDELVKGGMIESMTQISSPITEIWARSPSPDWNGKPQNLDLIMTWMGADKDFTKTLGVKLLQGNDFTGVPSDSSAMLLNMAAVEAMNLKEPIGMQMRHGPRIYNVIGVIDNIVMESPFKPVDPMMVNYTPRYTSHIHIRLKQDRFSAALHQIELIFKRFDPVYPFEFQFADLEFGKKFKSEELISKITNLFAGLAIFICCLGLAGLASFTIEKRVREIGIRKVLGASFQQLLMMISRDFLRLVLIAFLIAVPLTWWLMTAWLAQYEYRISVGIWLFAIVGLFIMMLTLIVVGLNTIRPAMKPPVQSLRTE